MIVAVIDAGTNTFHILIAEITRKGFKVIARRREFVKLAQSKISEIDQLAFQRGLATFGRFRELLDQYDVSEVRVVGTEALRTASNAAEFCRQVKREANLEIEIIDGLREANYIASGVAMVTPRIKQARMIVDIGGGSVEFIAECEGKILWLRSLPLGIAVLRSQFPHSNPLAVPEEKKIRNYIRSVLSTLPTFQQQQKFALVGASGTFETLAQMILQTEDIPNYVELDLFALGDLLSQVKFSTTKHRMEMKFLPESRVELIVPACILLEEILGMYPFCAVGVSAFAMKEGILSEILMDRSSA